MKRKLTLIALAFAVLTCTISFASAQDGRRYDDDDYRYHRDYDHRDYDRDNYRGDYRHDRQGMHVAYDVGYQDGLQVAREDSWRRKPFNAYPRGHNHADRGYQDDFGSRREYRERYAQAYHEGYEHGYQGDYGRGYYR